jgi:2-phosphosulfolactate phosphatase
VRFEWGPRGLDALGPGSDVIVVVDVLSFSTCVDVAAARGAFILPYRWRDGSADRYAREHGAVLAASERRTSGYSLSPASLAGIPAGTRLVLPSPNGAALSLRAAGYAPTVTACLRNAAAVAGFARRQGGTVAVIGGGEQWADGSLRPAWEDLIGAGAVLAHLPGRHSPEAQAACDAFRRAEGQLSRLLGECSSGRELLERGFAADLDLAAAYGVSACVPLLEGGAFVARPVESPAAPTIPEFGTTAPGAAYVLRPGGYAVIFSAAGEVAAVATPQGLALPGGGQDGEEPPEGAAVREVAEECGLRVRLGDCIGVADELVCDADERTGYRKRCTFFLAEVLDRPGPGEPDHELVWLSPRDAVARLRHESQRWAVAEACRRTGRWT